MGRIESVNVAVARDSAHARMGITGIDKRPIEGPVEVADPGEGAGSGLEGDFIGDLAVHGGRDQAVYAYAREDLDEWQLDLGRALSSGVFGENLTTTGVDLAALRIGERARIGESLLIEVTSPRVPCRTFAGWLEERGWIERFTERSKPGSYFRVLTPGAVRAGDAFVLGPTPEHEVTIELAFRAMTSAHELLPRLLEAGDALPKDLRERARRAAGRGD